MQRRYILHRIEAYPFAQPTVEIVFTNSYLIFKQSVKVRIVFSSSQCTFQGLIAPLFEQFMADNLPNQVGRRRLIVHCVEFIIHVCQVSIRVSIQPCFHSPVMCAMRQAELFLACVHIFRKTLDD